MPRGLRPRVAESELVVPPSGGIASADTARRRPEGTTSDEPLRGDETILAAIPPKGGTTNQPPRRLVDLAHTRSGDKGINANIAVIARNPNDYSRLCREVTASRVAAYLGLDDAGRVTRYEVPNFGALNFVIRGILANPLRIDVQGKALGQVLLEMPLEGQP